MCELCGEEGLKECLVKTRTDRSQEQSFGRAIQRGQHLPRKHQHSLVRGRGIERERWDEEPYLKV